MNKYLEDAYNGEFDWSMWEFEIRDILININTNTNGDNLELIYFNNTLIGFFWTSIQKPNSLWLDSIIIINEFQNKGIGSKIIDLLIDNNPEIRYIDLGVQNSNKQAIKFYEKNGFNIVDDNRMELFKTIHMKKSI